MKNEKIKQKQKVVTQMISIYCTGKHKTSKGKLCSDCQKLLHYAESRMQKCPYKDTTEFCSNCKIKCYKPDMQKKIRMVMRYSGPRMLIHHPILAIGHFIERFKKKSN